MRRLVLVCRCSRAPSAWYLFAEPCQSANNVLSVRSFRRSWKSGIRRETADFSWSKRSQNSTTRWQLDLVKHPKSLPTYRETIEPRQTPQSGGVNPSGQDPHASLLFQGAKSCSLTTSLSCKLNCPTVITASAPSRPPKISVMPATQDLG